MRKNHLHSRDARPAVPSRDLNDAFAAAAETLALFCRLRNVDAADLPAHEVDVILDLAFEEAAQLAAARREARRAG